MINRTMTAAQCRRRYGSRCNGLPAVAVVGFGRGKPLVAAGKLWPYKDRNAPEIVLNFVWQDSRGNLQSIGCFADEFVTVTEQQQ